MKKVLSVLLVTILMVVLSSCGNTADSTAAVRDGFYLTDSGESSVAHYLSLSTADNRFQSGPGMMMDIAFGDKYEVVGDRLICHEGFGGDAVIEFRVISDTQLELTAFDPGADGESIAYWLNVGDVYHFVDLPNYDDPPEKLFNTVDTAADALAKAHMGSAAVFENMMCTSGQELWDEFVESTDKGEPASILCAYYYTLDEENISPELYEEEKDNYPQLFYYLVEYDGESYTVTVRMSSEKEPESKREYKYMNHYTGDAPATASFKTYDYYVLVDDPEVTWEDIEKGMYSSQSGDWIDHCTIYENITK